jgi:hypothetical protein
MPGDPTPLQKLEAEVERLWARGADRTASERGQLPVLQRRLIRALQRVNSHLRAELDSLRDRLEEEP